jgi:glycerophosphoryl diester phosphodiesterase
MEIAMKKIKSRYRELMNCNNRSLFLIAVVFLVIVILFLLPLLNLGIKLALFFTDQSYLTLENLTAFLRNPQSLLLILFICMIIPIFFLTQMTTMIHYCNTEYAHRKFNLLRILFIGILKSFRSLNRLNFVLPISAFLLYLFTNIPLLIGITLHTNMESLQGEDDLYVVKGLIILFILFLGFIAYRVLFVVHFCVNQHQSFHNGVELSKQLLKGRSNRTLRIILLFNLGLTLVFLILYYLILLITALLVYLFADKSIMITEFLSIYPSINIYTTIFFSIIAFITNLNIITSLYTLYFEEDCIEVYPGTQPARYQTNLLPSRKHLRLLNGFLLFVLAVGLINFYITIRNDSYYLTETLSGIQISSHRGNSHVAPENTLPALENAIIARSDYAEIDVRQTQDGVIVLLHDSNLWRTTGINKNIWDITYDELSGFDAGSWFGKEFVETKIPTLEEAMKLCKGRIKLNIEIKSDRHIPELEHKLVALIDKYDFKYQCLIASSDYEALIKIKQLDKEIKTGYILSAFYGDFYSKPSVDYLSIRAKFVTKSVVDHAHKAGKEIHAWTVNSIQELERMKSIGVDCIITNNPTLAREVLYEDDTNKTFVELLNLMLRNRSFFGLVMN